MGVNSLPKTVNRQHRGRDLNSGPSALESSMLTTRLPISRILCKFPVDYLRFPGGEIIPVDFQEC